MRLLKLTQSATAAMKRSRPNGRRLYPTAIHERERGFAGLVVRREPLELGNAQSCATPRAQ
eukprot:4583884-Heterocapsa_arctica.AAC.1